MNPRHLQSVLSAGQYYTGGIDGILGPKSWAAIQQVESKFSSSYTFNPGSTTQNRRLTACLQAALNEQGFDPGPIDGWFGVFTEEALNAFLYRAINGQDETVSRTPLSTASTSTGIPHQNDVETVYGTPGSDIQSKIVRIELPFKLRIDWNLRQRTNKISVHQLAANQLKDALIAVHAHYGETAMRDLGIDRYAGAYNHRRMRGGSKWSMHAYGCAIDFFAAPNGLRTRCPQALFCRPEYKAFLDIMESHEWLPAIRLWGADAMHFQRARL